MDWRPIRHWFRLWSGLKLICLTEPAGVIYQIYLMGTVVKRKSRQCKTLLLLCSLFLATTASGGRALPFVEDFRHAKVGAFPKSLRRFGGETSATDTPMLAAFGEYHFVANRDFVIELARRTREESAKLRSGTPILLSGNLGGILHDPRWIEIAAAFDFPNHEYTFQRNAPEDVDLLHFYKTLEALETPALMMPTAVNNAAWSKREDPDFYAYMAAQAYALGHQLHVPYTLYDGTAYGRFYGRYDSHKAPFEFIADHKNLFDGFETTPREALVVPYSSGNPDWIHAAELRDAIVNRVKSNIPFRLFISGDFLESLDAASLKKFDRMMVFGSETDYSAAAWRTLQDAARSVPAGPGRPVAETDSPGLRILARSSIDARNAVVLHLLETPGQPSWAGGEIRLPAVREFAQRPQTIRLYRPSKEPEELQVRRANDAWIVQAPDIHIWGILVIELDPKAKHPPAPLRRPTPKSDIPIMRLAHRPDKETLPEWLVKSQARGIDPIEEFRASRVSWSYRQSAPHVDALKKRGIAFHGTVNIGASNPDAERTDAWPGWARHADGTPISFRSDFAGGPIVGSFASQAFLEHKLEATLAWVELGVNGVHWDDVAAHVHRSWSRGGDFSEGSLRGFSRWLQKRKAAAVPGHLSPQSLRQALLEEGRNAVLERIAESSKSKTPILTLPLIDAERDHPITWIATPELQTECDIVEAEIRFRWVDGPGRRSLGFYLFDGLHSVFAASLFANNQDLGVFVHGRIESTGLQFTRPFEWNLLRFRIDFSNQTVAAALNGSDLSDAYPFRNPGAASPNSFSIALQRRPNATAVEIDSISIEGSQ